MTKDEARAAAIAVATDYDNCCGFWRSDNEKDGGWVTEETFLAALAPALDAFERAVIASLPCYRNDKEPCRGILGEPFDAMIDEPLCPVCIARKEQQDG